ncbi:MFS transporter [Streptomyces aureoversilis]|uniref:MFS transporter n=1 Tax=Streptomyces aureoversilis TaxID=67277 RepID=A0ABW0A7H2_9ACTN
MSIPVKHTAPGTSGTSGDPGGTRTGRMRSGWMRTGWMMTASGWSANQFSALLGAYRSELGLSESTVTGLFALYVVGLVPGLLIGGPLADRRGRRPVALTALAVNLLSTCLLMAGSATTAWLLPGRFLTGVSAGALLAAGSAWVKELSCPPHAPDGAPGAAARRPGLFVSAGFASGGLVAALIAQWLPHPMATAYVPHVILVALAWVVAYRAPETRRPAAREGRDARAAAGGDGAAVAAAGAADAAGTAVGAAADAAVDWSRFRRAVLPLAPWVFAAPAIGFATLPGLVDGGLTGWRTVFAGIATAVVPGCGLLVQPLARRLAARHRFANASAGLGAITVGLALAVPAAAAAQPALALVAAAVLGAGYGFALSFGLTEAAASAPPARLAMVTSLFWTAAYLGMFVPYALALVSRWWSMPVLLAAAAVLAALTCGGFAALGGRRNVPAALHRTAEPDRPRA